MIIIRVQGSIFKVARARDNFSISDWDYAKSPSKRANHSKKEMETSSSNDASLEKETQNLSLNAESQLGDQAKLNPAASSFVPSFNAPSFVPGGVFSIVDEKSQENGSKIDKSEKIAENLPQKAVVMSIGGASANGNDTPTSVSSEKSSESKKPEKSTASKLKSQESSNMSQKQGSTASLASSASSELTEEQIRAEDEFYKAQNSSGKRHLNIVFMGHVDAGKSTIGGHLLFLTGMVDQRTMEKYEKEAKEQNRESWYLSWALDTDEKERAKGKTVECGRAFFETKSSRFTILDAPGHKNYVPSMISGASQADVGILVISARRGEFETGFEKGGQTREHAVLAKTVGIKRLVVAINKMDDQTVQWDKARYDECCSKLLPFLKQCGYNSKTDLTFCPISGFTGQNLKDPIRDGSVEAAKWYQGEALLEILDNLDFSSSSSSGADEQLQLAPFMFPISEKYKDMGTIVSGKIESGRVRKGKTVLIMPARKKCEVSAVFDEQDEEVSGAIAGLNCRLRLKNIEEEEILPGYIACDPKHPVKSVLSFEAQLMILEHKNIICAGYSAVMHVHASVCEVTIDSLLHLIDKKTNRRSKRPPMFAKKGQIVQVKIQLDAPCCMETFADYPQLGRFTLRDESKTIAMGKVTKLCELANLSN